MANTSHVVDTGRTVFSWHNLCYEVVVGKGKKEKPLRILHPMSGHVSSGHVLAIMGPSGAGKTSLLNNLAGRAPGGRIAGDIRVNGERVLAKQFKLNTSYVTQDDLLSAQYTVRETLMFAANMRMSPLTPHEQKVQRVEDVMMELGLVDVADTKIGGEFVRGISGGQKKRVAIGVELINQPVILFLDEPTSGLDSFTSATVMEFLNKIAQNNRAVVATIHQPRSSIYPLFDYLLLLSEGHTIYFGKADTAIDYFGRMGYQCPQEANPSDYFMDLLSVDHSAGYEGVEEDERRIEKLRLAFMTHEEDNAETVEAPAGSQDMGGTERKLNFFQQLRYLLESAWVLKARATMELIINLTSAAVLAVIIGVIYFNLGSNQLSVQDRQGLLLITTVNMGINVVFQMLRAFSVEAGVLKRERASGMYQMGPFVLAKLLAWTPFMWIEPIMASTILYWLPNLQRTPGNFFIFLLTNVLNCYVGHSMGLFLGALIPDFMVAQSIGSIIVMLCILFGGQVITVGNIPPYYVWLYWINYFAYAYRALLINEFTGLTFTCTENEIASNTCFYTTGEQVIAFVGFDKGPGIWGSLAILVGMALTFFFLAYLLLRWRKPFPVQETLRVNNVSELPTAKKAAKAISKGV